MIKKIILPLVVTAFFSCETKTNNINIKPAVSEEKVNSDSKVETKEVFNSDATKIGFGAFKTTAKKEVKGWFTEFSILGVNQESTQVEEIFASASIEINVSSLETNDEGRNERLLSDFFGKTSSSEKITGKVNGFNTDAKLVTLSLDFNGVTKDLDFSYELKGDTLNLNGVLNLAEVNGLEALNSINKACEALHKGEDGISKTWEDVNIYISTVLNK